MDHLTSSGWENLKIARASRGNIGMVRGLARHLISALGRANLGSGIAGLGETSAVHSYQREREGGNTPFLPNLRDVPSQSLRSETPSDGR